MMGSSGRDEQTSERQDNGSKNGWSLPRVGVSSCLLGQNVRYNGGNKKNDWLVDELSHWVEWVPFCPEMTMGMGTPRESVRLTALSRISPVQMVGNESRQDYTALAEKVARGFVAKDLGLSGYILKKNSPSCGLERVKIYGPKGQPLYGGSGIFARHLIETYPLLPVIEEGRLSDPIQREQFITRIYAFQEMQNTPARMLEIQRLHQRYKLVLMAHSPAAYRELGRIVANAEKLPPRDVLARYGEGFMKALAIPATARKRVNVLQHIFGYFKKLIDSKEKAQILDAIEEYRQGEQPLMAPLALLEHLVKKHDVEYLKDQKFFHPYPRQLKLMKHL